MGIKALRINIAKRDFQIHGAYTKGKPILKKRISRDQLRKFIANIPPCLIGREAGSGSNYWDRKFQFYGHDVKLLSPQFVKPYVKTNKNDAAAIYEAVTRPT